MPKHTKISFNYQDKIRHRNYEMLYLGLILGSTFAGQYKTVIWKFARTNSPMIKTGKQGGCLFTL